jgi:glycosyltransferase involved in cell wall biosynthesis
MPESNKSKVLIFIEGKFPTEKAYGITTVNTVRALEEIGYEVFIVSFNSLEVGKQKKFSATHYFIPESHLARIIRGRAYKSFGFLSKICWWISRTIAIRKAEKMILNIQPSIIWLRDRIPSRKIFDFSDRATFVLELHQLIKKSEIRTLSKISPSKLLVAPISDLIKRDFEEYGLKFTEVESPMGVNLEQFSSKLVENPSANKMDSSKKIVLGYFGKIAPNGYSKGVEDLLDLARLHKRMNFLSNILIVGASQKECEDLNSNLNYGEDRFLSIDIFPHLSHSEAINKMQSCDILVLPAASPDHYVGSPIKAIEYAATGKPILAASSQANRSVFNSTFQPFWYEPHNLDDMHLRLKEIIESSRLNEVFLESRNFAATRTWANRTQRIIDSVNKLS